MQSHPNYLNGMPDDGNKGDDINFVIRDLQYASVLDVPFYTRILHSLYSYFAKINASVTTSPILGYIYFIIVTIQSFFPAFLLDCQDIWPSDSLMTMVLNIISYLYQGPHTSIKSARVYVSFVLAIIFVALFVLVILRARTYRKTGRVTIAETKFMLYSFKYILPLFCPHILAGVGVSFDQIINQKQVDINIATIIFGIIVFGTQLFFTYAIVTPRVLLEDTLTHEWLPLIAFSSIANSSIMSLVSSLTNVASGKNRAGCSIWIFIQTLLYGLAVFYLNGYVKMLINVIVAAAACSAAVVSIIMTANFFLADPLAPEIIFVVGILIFIAFVVGFKVLKQMMVTNLMQLFDSLMDSRSMAQEIMENQFKNPYSFLGQIRSVMELWHPYLLTFELFNYAINKWPKNLEIQILYARILAFFPNKNTQMMWITSLIAKSEDRKSPTSYLLQLRHISRTRQTQLTMVIQKQLDEINSKKEILKVFLRRFWENILQRNTVNFWNEAAKVNKHVSELDAIMAQLIDNYPHNTYVVEAYHDFVENIKYDKVEAKEVLKRLDQLKNNKKARTDIALDLAVKVFPTLSSYSQTIDADVQTNNRPASVSLLIPPENNDNNLESDTNQQISSADKNSDLDSDTETQITTALNELTKHSPLGSVWIGCIIVILMTALTIGLFYFLYDTFVSGFLNQQEKSIEFLQEIDLTVYELNRLTININMYPLVMTRNVSAKLFSIFGNQSQFVATLAPKLWEAGVIPPMNLNQDSLYDGIKSIKERFTEMISALSILPTDDPYVQAITNIFTVPSTPGGMSTKNAANQMLVDSQEVVSYNTPNDYYLSDAFVRMKNSYLYVYLQFTTMSAIANQYASLDFDKNLVNVNERMVLVILVTLLLITLPFVIQIYIHRIQSNAIAHSFTLFPNTEIRSVINKFGKSTTDMDEDLSQVASLSQISSGTNFNTILFVLSFFSSFIVVIICSVIVYYSGEEFVDNAAFIANDIYTLYPAFSALSVSFIQAIRVFMASHESMEYIADKIGVNVNDNPGAIIMAMMSGIHSRYLSPQDIFADILEQAIQMSAMALMNFSNGMWSSQTSSITSFFADHGKSFDNFESIYPPNRNKPSYNKTYFEQLASLSLTEAIDLSIGYLFSYLYDFQNTLKKAMTAPDTVNYDTYLELTRHDERIKALTYWFSNFTDYNRSQPYFDLVESQVKTKIKTYEKDVKICLVLVIVWQIIACLILILYMYQDHNRIKRALRFYYYLNPTVVMSNKNAMTLLETGHPLSQDESGSAVANSEFIMSKIGQGIVFVDRELMIQEYNNAFSTTFQVNDVKNTSLVDICQVETDDRSWLNFIQLLHEIVAGKQAPQYTGNIIAHLNNGQIQHLHANVISLIGNQTANEGEQDAVDKIGIIFDDCTDIYMRQQMISQEEEHITAMLANVMPARVVHDFEAGGDTLSFVVQMVTIGQIRVTTTKQFDETTDEAFLFYNEIFTRFDQEIKSFEMLTKVRTFAHTYTYVGGLFSEVNKPERHAEEAIRFILALLKLKPELSEKYGAEIHFTSGVHTGGPVVAGVMSLTKPSFQIIGATMEMATQMKSKGVEDQIHITRAVYELIFSAGFNVQERGDTEIRGGKVIPTYLVRLR